MPVMGGFEGVSWSVDVVVLGAATGSASIEFVRHFPCH
jgi:hypothetical protein